jgi:hypothetical protein
VCYARFVPDKPTWCGHLEEIAASLRSLPDPWVDRSIVQQLLGVGLRRAQQILAPCVSRQIGVNGLADREVLISHLNRLSAGEAGHYEHRRRSRLAEQLHTLQIERRSALMVEAPVDIVNQQLDNLPPGVAIMPGRITVTFASSREALEKLLALAMAVGNDPLWFERLATGSK